MIRGELEGGKREEDWRDAKQGRREGKEEWNGMERKIFCKMLLGEYTHQAFIWEEKTGGSTYELSIFLNVRSHLKKRRL